MNRLTNSIIIAFFIVILLLGSMYFFPWSNFKWGNISLAPSQTVTVTGTAKSEQKSQIAVFSAGINVVNDDKDAAVKEANEKIEEIISALKTFGIPATDIKTANLNIYQSEITYYDNGVQKQRPGQWRVGNNVEIKLRDVDKASALTDLLSNSGANNVYGPNFQLDDTASAENDLLADAMKDARTKADIMANAAGKKIGKTLSISEGYQSSSPIYALRGDMGGGGGAPVEPGTATVSKSVTVTFELK